MPKRCKLNKDISFGYNLNYMSLKPTREHNAQKYGFGYNLNYMSLKQVSAEV